MHPQLLARAAGGVAVATSFGLLLSSCGSSTSSDLSPPAQPSSAAPSAAVSTDDPSAPGSPVASTSYPLTITQCGRALTFEEAPTSISIDGERYALPLIEMGLGDRITSAFSHTTGILNADFDVDPAVVQQMRDLPALVGDANSAYPSREAFVAAAPDLVIEAYNGDAGGGDPKATDALVELGIPVFTLSPSCSEASLANTMDDIRKLGAILDRQEQAEALVSFYEQRIDAAGERAKAAGPGTPTAFFLDGFGEKDEIWANTGVFAADLVEAGGAILVPANASPDDIYTVSREAVVASRPDILLTYTTENMATDVKVGKLWPLLKDSAAEQRRDYTVVPYPDGAGTVEFVEGVADAVVSFKTGG